ncbi:MAG: OmpH family outer membrane protein [Bacteroidetes bacterium]|nr:OmpH family outer membrane protein [Bacteroidota bacterium]
MTNKIIVLLIASLFISVGTIQAQQKYGHINSSEILEAMPEYKQMTAVLEKKQKDAQLQMQKMYQDYQARQKELSEYGMSMMMAVREEKMLELDSLQQTLDGFEGKASADIQKMHEKLMTPLNDKYIKIVNQVAKENGYSYIFDIAAGILVYYPENSGDITNMVKQKMGIN